MSWKHFFTDAWENAITLLGTSFSSLANHKVVLEPFLDLETLEALYRDAIARRVILAPVKASFKKGFVLVPPDDTVDPEPVRLELKKHLPNLKRAIIWGRRDGRGGLLLGAVDGTEDPTEPLDLERVTELRWTEDLRASAFTAGRLNHDLRSERYGWPEYWRLSTSKRAYDVHESRIIITGSGIPTDRDTMEQNDWREMPLLQSVADDLRNYDSAKTGIAQMLVDASQAVLSITNLPAVLAEEGDVLRDRLRILAIARAHRILPINAGSPNGTGAEKFEYIERTFSGVADAFDRVLGGLASSIGWPQTYIFGRSPAGQNSTGESDRELWDDLVLSVQEDEILGPINELVAVIAQAQGAPMGWSVKFSPLRQMSEAEQAGVRKTIAETDVIYTQAGILDELVVSKQRFGGDEPDFEPIRLEDEDVRALEALQEIDRNGNAQG